MFKPIKLAFRSFGISCFALATVAILPSCSKLDQKLRPFESGVSAVDTSPTSPKFLELVKQYAVYPAEFEILKPITVAQWILETGWGNSSLAQDHNNFGGMMWRTELAEIEGNYGVIYTSPSDNITTNYLHTSSIQNWFKSYWRFIDRWPYVGWRDNARTGEEYIRFIKSKGYAGDPKYVDKVLSKLPAALKLLADVGWVMHDTPFDPPVDPCSEKICEAK